MVVHRTGNLRIFDTGVTRTLLTAWMQIGFLDRDQQRSLLLGPTIRIELLSSAGRRQLLELHNVLATNSDLQDVTIFKQYFNFTAYYC